jgi:hypothetical protein
VWVKIVSIFLFLLIPAVMWPAEALSEIVVHDMIAPAGREVMLRAETRGALFLRGGDVVEFFVDGKPVGKTLSGGDGIAFMRFVPARTGLYKIRVKSDGDKEEGVLLAVKGSTQVVFIDVEGSLLERSFALKPRSGSVQAVKKITRKYPVVFLQTGYVGLKVIKLWLKENGFPDAPVLSWSRGEVFGEIGERALKMKAIIGKPDVIQSAKTYKPRGFSFDATDEAEAVQDWEEIVKKLK